jgi:hypothetical protein
VDKKPLTPDKQFRDEIRRRANTMADSDGKDPYRRFIRQRENARKRGIDWNLTFAEWWLIWDESGKWQSRGPKGYVMGRSGDVGPYETGNVTIITTEQNSSEYIRRYWQQVKTGEKPPPKRPANYRKHPYHALRVGQSITRERTMSAAVDDQNYAHRIARQNGWRFSTRTNGQTITVTRIS